MLGDCAAPVPVPQPVQAAAVRAAVDPCAGARRDADPGRRGEPHGGARLRRRRDIAGLALVALTRRPRTTIFGYAAVVMAIPFLSGRLLVAVGEDRSSAAVASATAAALERSGGTGTVLGVLAYAPSLPFYLGRPIAVATETGRELTSNYI